MSWHGVEGVEVVVSSNHASVTKSFTDKPNGSNSIEQELSVVNLQTERRFWMRLGATRILLR
jgi:hypothetical protein